jgi:hypothetical protein
MVIVAEMLLSKTLTALIRIVQEGGLLSTWNKIAMINVNSEIKHILKQ